MSKTEIPEKTKAQAWESRLKSQEASGLTIVEYCRGERLPIWRFRYWRRKLRGVGEVSKQKKFVQITYVDPAPQLASRLILGPGMVLETSRLPDPRWVSELMDMRSKRDIA